METNNKKEKEAQNLKALAELTYTTSPTTNLKPALTYATQAHNLSPSLDGLSETLTAFQILSSATATAKPEINWYEVLQTEPFCHVKAIKKQYRKLALTLHPDKNPFSACEEAFKWVSEAYSVLSDKAKRNEYDTKLRMALQVEATKGCGVAERESFWTLCVTCRLMHQFERKYLGFNLMCPGCNKSFKASEFDFEDDRNRDKGVGEVLETSMPVNGGLGTDSGVLRSEHGKGTRVLGKCKSKTTEIAEGGVSLNNSESSDDIRELRSKRGVGRRVLGKVNKLKRAEITEEENMLANGGIRELRSKRGVRTKDFAERWVNMEDDEEEEITLAKVLERSMRGNGNGSGVSTSKRGTSKLKKGEIEEEEVVLSEMFERSIPGKGGLRSRRGVGTNESSKSKRFEIQDDRTIMETLMPENGALGSKNVVNRSKTVQGGVVFDGKSVSMRDADETRSKRAGIGEEESTSAEVFERSIPANSESRSNDNRVLRPKRGVRTRSFEENIVEEGITLAEMQMRAKKKVREEKMRLRVKEKREEREKANNKKRRRVSADVDMEIMSVIDSDFYDFDKDRVAKSFKKGQVWAVYDDDDGMPRHYGLIDEVSVYPFKIRLLWLDLECSSNEALLSWDKTRVRVSCGRFKVAETDTICSVNIFSHSVMAERAAREVYRIYPKKGSVWALFNENTSQNSDKRCYDIVVCLSSYDDTYGLSMGYLEKVEGFKTVFKRREVGSHAVKWLEKPDFQLFSHQIPARKLSGEEAPGISRDCWELDPASLPPELLSLLA